MRRKSILLLFLTLVSFSSMTGCIDTIQLNERAIVQAVGIDWENDAYLLTLQIFSPVTGGGTGIDATAENAKVIQAEGKTISEAVQNANLVQGKRLFVGHNRIIIIGSALARQGLEQILSYFSSNPWSRQNVYLAMAEEKAGDILSAKINQGILPAETLEKIMVNSEENGLIKSVQMVDFLKALDNQYESSFMPVIRLNPKGEKGDAVATAGGGGGGGGGEGGGSGGSGDEIEPVSSVELCGTALFSQAKSVAVLGRDASRGILWLRNEIQKTDIDVESQKYAAATLRVYESKSTLIPHLVQEDALHFRLEIEAKCIVGESKLRENTKFSLEDINELQKAGEAVIAEESRQAFQTAMVTYGADIFNFGDLVWKNNIQLWKALHDNWPEVSKNMTLDVEVHLNIDRVGLEFQKDSEKTEP